MKQWSKIYLRVEKESCKEWHRFLSSLYGNIDKISQGETGYIAGQTNSSEAGLGEKSENTVESNVTMKQLNLQPNQSLLVDLSMIYRT